MKKVSTTLIVSPPTGMGAVGKAWDAVSVSFDRFCLTAGIEALGTMMGQDAEQACGARHARGDGRRGHRCRAADRSGAGLYCRAQPDQFSTVFWDVFGEQGHPVRAMSGAAAARPTGANGGCAADVPVERDRT